MALNHRIKSILSWLLPDSFALRYFARLGQFGAWRKSHQIDATPGFPERDMLYKHLYESELSGQSLEYFEMGVWYGAAIKSWNSLDQNPDSRYYGFDTFQGLPEVWEGLTADAEVGTFHVGGSVDNVKIDDERVQLIEGLFQDTVPEFLRTTKLGEADRRILHIDSDLYSSALFCLCSFDSVMRANDIVIFDELSSMDEFQALLDYQAGYRREYKVLGHAGSFFQCLAIQFTN